MINFWKSIFILYTRVQKFRETLFRYPKSSRYILTNFRLITFWNTFQSFQPFCFWKKSKKLCLHIQNLPISFWRIFHESHFGVHFIFFNLIEKFRETLFIFSKLPITVWRIFHRKCFTVQTFKNWSENTPITISWIFLASPIFVKNVDLKGFWTSIFNTRSSLRSRNNLILNYNAPPSGNFLHN